MKLLPLREAFTVCQIRDGSGVDWSQPFTFVSRTDEELSLVCPTGFVPGNAVRREDGWRAFRVQGALDFSLTGILAGIAAVLAEEGIAIFAVSTYNTDYVLVKDENFSCALRALEGKGYEIEEEQAE